MRDVCLRLRYSVITGMGERQQEEHTRQAIDTSKPYLLLDIRELDEFRACHIVTGLIHPLRSSSSLVSLYAAKSFPSSRLSRATNVFTAQVNAYLNQVKRVITFQVRNLTLTPYCSLERLLSFMTMTRALPPKLPTSWYKEALITSSCCLEVLCFVHVLRR